MADGGPLIEKRSGTRFSERLDRDPVATSFVVGFVAGWLLMTFFGDWVWWRDLLVGYIVGIAAVLVLPPRRDERGEAFAWWLITAALAALILLSFTPGYGARLAAHPSERGAGTGTSDQSSSPCAPLTFDRPHFSVYDAVVTGHRFGPEVPGRTTTDVLAELQRRLCFDPALLVDLHNYAVHGIKLTPRVLDGREGEIDRLIDNPDEWDQAVIDFMADVEGPTIDEHDGSYRSWWYKRGSSPTAIPSLHSSGSPERQSTFLAFRYGGSQRWLRLECDFQPSDPS
jgi:hypothetical protein